MPAPPRGAVIYQLPRPRASSTHRDRSLSLLGGCVACPGLQPAPAWQSQARPTRGSTLLCSCLCASLGKRFRHCAGVSLYPGTLAAAVGSVRRWTDNQPGLAGSPAPLLAVTSRGRDAVRVVLLDCACPHVTRLIPLAWVSFMDSTGLNLLLKLRRRLLAEGGHLLVTGLQPQPAHVLRVTETDTLLTPHAIQAA
ncbi:STAS domain-containing protein [Streptomyces sp. NPDC048481]|uniref:STAS domain-containing protein n=1 Tax=Streptomyces sp. NPDC048481 TaxID=3365557 RepID=UPI003717A31B